MIKSSDCKRPTHFNGIKVPDTDDFNFKKTYKVCFNKRARFEFGAMFSVDMTDDYDVTDWKLTVGS